MSKIESLPYVKGRKAGEQGLPKINPFDKVFSEDDWVYNDWEEGYKDGNKEREARLQRD